MEVLESNRVWKTTCLGEPQLGKRGLYPTISHVGSVEGWVRDLRNILAYSDGQHDVLSLAEILGLPFSRCLEIVTKLVDANLLTESSPFD
jgi:aminopeptidase-like protein